nr:hypothetical protein pPsy0462b_00113 [Pseudomonas syringae]
MWPEAVSFLSLTSPSTFITLRTKNGVPDFLGQGLAGLLLRPCAARQDGDVAVAGQFSVTVKVPRKNELGVTVGYDDKDVHRNQWAPKVEG